MPSLYSSAHGPALHVGSKEMKEKLEGKYFKIKAAFSNHLT